MKNLKFKHTFLNQKKSNYPLDTITSIIIALLLFYGCTSDNSTSSDQNRSLIFEKQLVVTDKSGRNSITLRISTNDETSLNNNSRDSYELVINPKIPEETTNKGFKLNFEKLEPTIFQNDIKQIKPTVKLVVVSVNFKDEVHSYSLISNASSKIPEEEYLKGINFCRWFPRDFQYYQIDNYSATSIKTTFARSKKTCNNIEYHISEYGSSSPFKSYQLKHPGDEETTNAIGQGMTVYYKYKKNSVVTYTWHF